MLKNRLLKPASFALGLLLSLGANAQECESFSTYYVQHNVGTNGSTLYNVDLNGSEAHLTELAVLNIKAHIGVNAEDNVIYLVDQHADYIDVYDVANGSIDPADRIELDGGHSFTATVYNPADGMLYLGCGITGAIYTLDPQTGTLSFYANASVSAGDISFINNKLYLASRVNQSSLFHVTTIGETLVGSLFAEVNGLATTEDNHFLVANNGQMKFFKVDADGVNVGFYHTYLNGEMFTLGNGDLASGCTPVSDPNEVPEPCYGDFVIEYVEGTKSGGNALDADRTDATKALGEPEGDNTNNFVSLGYGGSITIGFAGAVYDGAGDDIIIVETSFASNDCLSDGIERAQVELTQNGVDFISAGEVCRDGSVDIATTGLEYVVAIRIINDASSTTFDGYDVDGVIAVMGCAPVPDITNFCTADEVLSYTPGLDENGNPVAEIRSNPENALGEPQRDNTYNFVTLGFGGELILKFSQNVINGEGDDLEVVETTFSGTCASYEETAEVYVSQYGVEWALAGIVCHDGFVDISNANPEWSFIRFVKIVDITSMSSNSEDAYDVDGVVALHGCEEPLVPEIGGCEASCLFELGYVQGTSHNGGSIAADRTHADRALAVEGGDAVNSFVSLGYGGSIVLCFDGAVYNGEGDDLQIVETSFGDPSCANYNEYADIEVSVDGVEWYYVATGCLDFSVDISDASPFIEYINYVRISNNDDLSNTPDGYDVDGVIVLNGMCDEGDEDGETGPEGLTGTAPQDFVQLSVWPNPTEGQTNFQFSVEEDAHVSVEIFNTAGQRIATVFSNSVNAQQEYQTMFDASSLPNGIYLYRLTTEKGEVIMDKFMLAR